MKTLRVIFILIVMIVIATILKNYGWQWVENLNDKLREKGDQN